MNMVTSQRDSLYIPAVFSFTNCAVIADWSLKRVVRLVNEAESPIGPNVISTILAATTNAFMQSALGTPENEIGKRKKKKKKFFVKPYLK